MDFGMGPFKSSLSIVDNISKLVKFPMDSGIGSFKVL